MPALPRNPAITRFLGHGPPNGTGSTWPRNDGSRKARCYGVSPASRYDGAKDLIITSPSSSWIDSWLTTSVSASTDGTYRHQLVRETDEGWKAILPQLVTYVEAAHEDVRRHLSALVSVNLSPFEGEPTDPAEGYPGKLHPDTLRAYFGEIMAGLVAENLSPFGYQDWVVPAPLFRFHLHALHQIEHMRQTGAPSTPLPGRPGDDCLAFQKNSDGEITRSLVAEAKCTSDHDAHLIADGFRQLSKANTIPVDVPRLIDILRDRDDAVSASWAEALIRLFHGVMAATYERCDLLAYTYCREPKKAASWIDPIAPHAQYSGSRRIEAVEVCVPELNELIASVYS